MLMTKLKIINLIDQGKKKIIDYILNKINYKKKFKVWEYSFWYSSSSLSGMSFSVFLNYRCRQHFLFSGIIN